MTSRPRLAMLIPAYNAARFLPRLLASAQAQTEPFDEIWVHDDCSTDDTAAVARAYGARVVTAPVNRGCSAGKNVLAEACNAEWLHFHDADDELLPHFAEIARRRIAEDTADVVLFDYEWRDDETGALLKIVRFDRAALEADARRSALLTQMNPFCGLYRRSAIRAAGGWNEDPRVLYNEDVAFHVRLAFAGLRFSAENVVSVINYRVAGSMSSNNTRRCTLAHVEVMRDVAARPDAAPYADAIGERLWKASAVLASVGAGAEARATARFAARIAPCPPQAGAPAFRMLAALSPEIAVDIRERVIRTFKPSLRSRSTSA